MTNEVTLVPGSIGLFAPARAELERLKDARDKAGHPVSEEIREILRRLTRLDHEYQALMTLNDELSSSDPVRAVFDEPSDTMTLEMAGETLTIRIPRADPAVPITVISGSHESVYHPEKVSSIHSPTSEPLRLQLETQLEGFYQNAHRVQKLMRSLPGLRSFECRPITIVRNKLIEHPSGSEKYSFGYGSKGPVARPLLNEGSQWIDDGLVANAKAFADALVAALAKRQ